MLRDTSPADIARIHLPDLVAEPLLAPFVRRVLEPLLASAPDARWQAGRDAWGTVFRVTLGDSTCDFVFWTEEPRFSFFVGTREEMDEYPASPEEAEEAAQWLEEFLARPDGTP